MLKSERERMQIRSAPTLGALLRLAHQQFARRAYGAAGAAGYRGLRPSHVAVTLPLFYTLQGLTATELAARAGITKQVIGGMIHDLEAEGYVERRPHGVDGRSRVVRLTTKGRAVVRYLRASSLRLETACGQRLGARRIKELYKLLRGLGLALIEMGTHRPTTGDAALAPVAPRSRRVGSSRDARRRSEHRRARPRVDAG